MKKVILSALVFAVVGLTSVYDAFGDVTCQNLTDTSQTIGLRACTTNSICPTGWRKISNYCSTSTVGGNITYVTHHGIGIKCVWIDYQGSWSANPGVPTANPPVPMIVKESVEGTGNYATCGGWDIADVPVGNPDFSTATHGVGQFFFNVTYSSKAPVTCTEDANAGIGNNCTKTNDAQNPKHNGGTTTTAGATRACENLPGGGTELTYQYFCADGVSVTGFLTLVPTINGQPQPAPDFTSCNAERVAAGQCTMQLGGIPTKTVKIQGKNVTVVDSDACLAAFPGAQVANALNSGQTQNLVAKALLFYSEAASEGSCDASSLPTVQGLPSAAYGRYCQSDLGLFSDNKNGNLFGDDLVRTAEGFDNELRVCPTAPGSPPHTASQDVEQLALPGGVILEPQGPLNLNCTTGGNTDSGGYTVKIPDQTPLLSIDIDRSPLNEAPKLEGFPPSSATIIVDTDGVRKLALRYPTCSQTSGAGLSDFIKTKYNPTNNSNVTLQLEGQTNGTGLGPILFDGQFTIKVNGL